MFAVVPPVAFPDVAHEEVLGITVPLGHVMVALLVVEPDVPPLDLQP